MRSRHATAKAPPASMPVTTLSAINPPRRRTASRGRVSETRSSRKRTIRIAIDSKSGCMVNPATMNAMVPHRRSRRILLPLLAVWSALSACAPPARPSIPPPLVVSDRGGAMRIFELGERGAVARLVGSARADDRSYADTLPVRLPDGRIAFVSDRGGHRSIYLTSSGSAAATPLLLPAAPPDDDSDPAPL